jgi:WD40 repeat protein
MECKQHICRLEQGSKNLFLRRTFNRMLLGGAKRKRGNDGIDEKKAKALLRKYKNDVEKSWEEWKNEPIETIGKRGNHKGVITSIAVLEDRDDANERKFVTGSDDHTVKIWANGKCERTLQGYPTFGRVKHSGAVTCVVAGKQAPNIHDKKDKGQYSFVASGSEDNTIMIWEKVGFFRENPTYHRSKDGYTMGQQLYWGTEDRDGLEVVKDADAIAQRTKTKFDRKIWQDTLRGHDDTVTSLVLQPPAVSYRSDLGESEQSDWGWPLLLSGSLDKTVKIWGVFKDSLGYKCLKTLTHTHGIHSIAAGRHFLVSGSKENMTVWVKTGVYKHTNEKRDQYHHPASLVRFETAALGQEISEQCTSVAINGDNIVTGSLDTTVKIWESDYHNVKHTLRGHSAVVTSVVIAGGDRIVSGSLDKTVKVWTMSGECIRTLYHQDTVISLAVRGNHIISGSNQSLQIWELEPETGVEEKFQLLLKVAADKIDGRARAPRKPTKKKPTLPIIEETTGSSTKKQNVIDLTESVPVSEVMLTENEVSTDEGRGQHTGNAAEEIKTLRAEVAALKADIFRLKALLQQNDAVDII